MSVTVQRILAAILGVAGMLVVIGYALIVALASNRSDATETYGSLAGLAVFAVVAALFWGFWAAGREAPLRISTMRVPPVWLSLIVFVLMVGAGFTIRLLERGDYFAPLLAVIAFVAVSAFFLRLAAGWLPGRRLERRNVVLPALWGALVCPPLLILFQGSAALVLFGAAIGGFYANDPDFEFDPNLEERIADYFDEVDSGATTTELPDIAASPTIALGISSLVAIIAPISEELLKAVGAILVLSRRAVVHRKDAFVAGVAAGLGFAVFEGIGYTLASPGAWQQIILIRAPVVVMHVAATTIVTLGWYRYRRTGRGFIPYFAIGTLVHAGWNALSIGFVYIVIGLDDGADPSTAQALAFLAVGLLLAALFVAACAWLVASARRAGQAEPHGLAARRAEVATQLAQPVATI